MKEENPSTEQEFNRLINRFSNFIYAQIQKAYPQSLGLDRDDLFQEVGIVLWKLLKSEKKIKHQSSYIVRIVNSVVIDHIRSARRQQRTMEVEKHNGNPLYQRDEEEENQALIQEALMKLSEPRRRAVRLHLLNLDIEEIASVCHWTKAKTRNLIYRGLKDIKDILGEGGNGE